MTDDTQLARDGFNAPGGSRDNPFIESSHNWMMFEIGAYLQRTGRAYPDDVRKSRGYTVKVKDMLFKWSGYQGTGEPEWIRLS